MPNLKLSNYWNFSESKCSARIRTRVSSSNLVRNLPIHQHENKSLPVYFRKAVHTKLGNLGLQSFYNGNVEFNELVHRVYALSFVPPISLLQFY